MYESPDLISATRSGDRAKVAVNIPEVNPVMNPAGMNGMTTGALEGGGRSNGYERSWPA